MAEKSSPRVRWDAATRHAANPRIEEPDAGIPHVRIRGGPGAVTPWVYPRLSTSRDQNDPLSENVIPTGDGLTEAAIGRRGAGWSTQITTAVPSAAAPTPMKMLAVVV